LRYKAVAFIRRWKSGATSLVAPLEKEASGRAALLFLHERAGNGERDTEKQQ
jgi:hypothetical protein